MIPFLGVASVTHSQTALQEPVLDKSISYLFHVKTEHVLNTGGFVSRLVSRLISKVVRGYMFIMKEIR